MKRTRGTSAGASKNWGQNQSKPKKTYYESWKPYDSNQSWSDYADWEDFDNEKNVNYDQHMFKSNISKCI